MKQTLLLSLFIFLISCDNETNTPSELNDISTDKLSIDGFKEGLETSTLDTITVDGVVKIIRIEFTVNYNEETLESDTTYNQTDTLTIEENTQREEQDNNSINSEARLYFKNERSTSVYVEVWAGYNLAYEDGIVEGHNLSRPQRIKEIQANAKLDSLTVDTDKDAFIIVGLFREDNFIYLTEFNYSPSSNSNDTLILDNSGFLGF